MPASTFAGTATAVFTMMTAVIVTLGTVVTYITARNARVAAEKLQKQSEEIHTIVNQQRTDMQRYIRAQTALLKEHGIEPPVDQSIDPTE